MTEVDANTNPLSMVVVVAESQDGLALVSYLESGNGDLKVARCLDASCSSVARTTVDAVGETGAQTAITIGADGLPLITYQDVTNDDLRIAHCSNVFCIPYFRRR